VGVTVALYPGSFDPFHLGHLSVVERAALLFDRLVIAVMSNPAKTGFLSIDQRVALLQRCTNHLGNVRCVSHDGLTVDAVAAERADLIVRALGKEAAAEYEMAAMNVMVSGIRTIFVASEPTTARISSTVVRSMVAAGRLDKLSAVVPGPVSEVLRRARYSDMHGVVLDR